MLKNRYHGMQQKENELEDVEQIPLNVSEPCISPKRVVIDIPWIDIGEEKEDSQHEKITNPRMTDLLIEDGYSNSGDSTSSDDQIPNILDSKKDANPESVKEKAINVKGKTQHMTLHLAAFHGDAQITELLLENGADPHVEDSLGRSPSFIAAAMGRERCLEIMIKWGANPNARISQTSYGEIVQSSGNDYLPSTNGALKVQMLVWSGSTVLHEAVRANSPECVKILLEAGAEVDATDGCEATPLLLAGAGLIAGQTVAIARYERVVQLLVEKGANGNACSDGMATSALLNAVFLGSVPALRSLLEAKADPGWSSENGGSTTAVHEAAGSGRADMLRVLIYNDVSKKRKQDLANLADSISRTPLHKAAYAGSRECVSLLLECGANLSLATNTRVTGIEAILKHVPDSKTFLSSLLDSCITCNSCGPEERDFALWLDFGFLVPESNRRQTAVLNALFTAKSISDERRRTLLIHPLVEAFVRFKWHELRKYFMVVVAVNTLFVLSLSAFVTLEYTYHKSLLKQNNSFSMTVRTLKYLHLFFAILVLMNVLGQCVTHFQYYMRQIETWTNGLSALLSIYWTLASDLVIISSEETPFWIHHIISITLPLAWAGMMLLLGRFPMWGSRALLFGVVLRNVIWTLLVLGLMISGFSFSFFVQFHESNSDAFGDPWKAFVNTMVMMTGEYEYLDIFKENKIFLPVTSRVLYLIFIVVASIVLVNLIVGLAVTDTQAMNSESEARSLYKRTEFVDLLECMIGPIVHHCALVKNLKIKVHGTPGEKNYIITHILPQCLVDSLVKIALSQRQKVKKTQVLNSLPFTLPSAVEGSLERKICNIMERFVKEILEAIKENEDVYHD